MGINIRLLKQKEFPDMLKLVHKIFPNANVKIESRDSIIVAYKHNEVIGFVHYATYPDKAIIKGFGIEGNTRGIGIGTNLMRQTIDRFEKLGKPVFLKVKMLNPAVNVYSKLGFFLAKINEGKGIYTLVRKANN